MSGEAQDLISKLLVLSPSERLGTNSVNDIRTHPFFEGTDWENLRKTKPPFVPKPKNPEDTDYFWDRKELHQSESSDPFGTFAVGSVGTLDQLATTPQTGIKLDSFSYVNHPGLVERTREMDSSKEAESSFDEIEEDEEEEE